MNTTVARSGAALPGLVAAGTGVCPGALIVACEPQPWWIHRLDSPPLTISSPGEMDCEQTPHLPGYWARMATSVGPRSAGPRRLAPRLLDRALALAPVAMGHLVVLD